MGIPLTEELINKLPEDTRKAFDVFEKWFNAEKHPTKKTMPDEVRSAFALINSTPIPGHRGKKCSRLCYMRGAKAFMAMATA
jgi:hypothetical protein